LESSGDEDEENETHNVDNNTEDSEVSSSSEDDPSLPTIIAPSRLRSLSLSLDFDQLTSLDTYFLISSILSPTASIAPLLAPISWDEESVKKMGERIARGRILGVGIYKSEFGKRRLAEEETLGPGRVRESNNK
jgi:hypothetical protein